MHTYRRSASVALGCALALAAVLSPGLGAAPTAAQTPAQAPAQTSARIPAQAPVLEPAQMPAQTPPLEIGAVAPDFELPGATRFGTLENPVRLSDFKGKTVVLAFFFRARTPG